ncbi:acyltransferase family protein [Pacificimonas sp. ICDLI1SI03]
MSGYLITSILARDLDRGNFSFIDFYGRRLKRIIPALIVVVGCCFPLAWATMLPFQLVDFSESVIATALIVSNILFFSESGYFAEASELKPLLHTWSLAVEEQFYLIFPLILLIIWRGSSRQRWRNLVLISIVSFILCEYASGRFSSANFFLLPTRAWEFLIGSLCALHERTRGRQSRGDFTLLGLVIIITGIFLFDEATRFPSIYTIVPVFGAVLVIIFGGEEGFAGRILSNRLTVGIGLISYSAYLWHQPVLVFSRLGFGQSLSSSTIFVLSMMSLPLAWLSWRYIEQPFRNASWSQFQVYFIAFCATGLLIIFGLLGTLTSGGLWRYKKEDQYLVSMNVADMGEYTRALFTEFEGQEFPDNEKKNVVIIGDSFAQDLTNMIFASQIHDKANVSTFYISANCGNLDISSDMSLLIEPIDRRKCAFSERYNRPLLLNRMRDSDAVLLASSWRDWQIPLLKESVDNIRRKTKGRVLIFNRKAFAEIDQRALVEVRPHERPDFRAKADPINVELNQKIANIEGVDIIDIYANLCGVEDCPVFTPAGNLISYDGAHLTPEGAAWAGRRLAQDAKMKFLLQAR